MITQSYRFTSLQHSKSKIPTPPPKGTSNRCSISHALTCLLHSLKRHYHVQRCFPHLPIRSQRNPVHISHSIYTIRAYKKSYHVVLTSYLSYMTIHYQHARNGHANATKSMKCIKPYRHKKSSLKFYTTRNESWDKFP